MLTAAPCTSSECGQLRAEGTGSAAAGAEDEEASAMGAQ